MFFGWWEREPSKQSLVVYREDTIGLLHNLDSHYLTQKFKYFFLIFLIVCVNFCVWGRRIGVSNGNHIQVP